MEHTFSDQVLRQFGFLQERYNFWGAEEYYTHQASGSGSLLIESDRYSLEFIRDATNPQVTIHIGRPGQPRTDMAWVFAYLTQGIQPGKAPWLYYAPAYPLVMNSFNSINWQMERLADILQPLWPAVFIFLDMDGPRSADFLAFKERAERTSAAESMDDGYRRPTGTLSERAQLGFTEQADRAFAYLRAYHYQRVYADPIFVRYESEGERPVYINIFHRSHSYEIGVHTGWALEDPSSEANFDLHELAAWSNQIHHPIIALKAGELHPGLNQTARHFRRYAAPLLAGDIRLLDALLNRRIDMARRVSRAWAERNRSKMGVS